MQNTIETDRLLLRPLTVADAKEAYTGWTGDAEAMKYVSWLPHRSMDETITWIKDVEWPPDYGNSIQKRNNYIWGFVLKETGKLFGSGGLIWEDAFGMFQVGYNISKHYWNLGYTTEAMKAILRFAAFVLGITKVSGGHAKDNHASRKVLEKLGFVYREDSMTPHVDGTRNFDSREYTLYLNGHSSVS